ncbi:hypothetical protein [Mesorhizobium sp. M0036]|uniref:hypothetical protein n=1 Tax=Mesorhizobium sp. M0036 TaxID=2956853 RepID=UPI00333BCF45
MNALADDFRSGCVSFIAAIRAGGGNVTVNSTRRPAERAYLMHYSWRIHKKTINPQNVPSKTGVDIDWVHRNSDGTVNIEKSRNAATAMVEKYDIAFQPSLTSRHVTGHAIDMSIGWRGDLKVQAKDGTEKAISTLPRDGFNLSLRKVGKSYGVTKHSSDPPHWSTDGK